MCDKEQRLAKRRLFLLKGKKQRFPELRARQIDM